MLLKSTPRYPGAVTASIVSTGARGKESTGL